MAAGLGTQYSQQTKLPASSFTGTGTASVSGTTAGHTHSLSVSGSGNTAVMSANSTHTHGFEYGNINAGGSLKFPVTEKTALKIDDIDGLTTKSASVEHTHYFSVTSTGTSGSATDTVSSSGSASITVNGGGDTFTRPLAVGVNRAIKKTCEILTKKWIVKKVNTSMIISAASLTVLTAGTAGTCSIDIKKGSSLGSLSSIYSTKPSVMLPAATLQIRIKF
jgi:hypothetical protein